MINFLYNTCKETYSLARDIYESTIDFFDPTRGSRRIKKLEELTVSGKLNQMDTHEIHDIMGIRKWSNEF
jgi:hypothetical protein